MTQRHHEHEPHCEHERNPWREPEEALVTRLEREARLGAALRATVLEEVARALDAPPRVILELGSGIGADTAALAERFPSARVHAFDVSAELLDRVASTARNAGVAARVETHRLDLNRDWAAAIPGEADLIWASSSLHHLEDPARALRRAFASLRAGGALVLIEPKGGVSVELGESEVGAARLAERLEEGLSMPIEYVGIEWSKLLAEAGFVLAARREHGFVVRGDAGNGAAHLESQFRSVRDRIVTDLPRAEAELLDAVIEALPTGRSGVSTGSTLEMLIAVRPAAGEGRATLELDERIDVDVAVLGGGAAGLAASVALARSRRRVVVIDAGAPRNAAAAGAHNLLGQEGVSPLELLARGRREAESYGVRILPGLVTAVTGQIDAFTVDSADGVPRVHARRIVLAGGLEDDLPEIPGVAAGWGHSVLHCPFCHGWEVRDQRIAVLGRGEVPIHQAMLFSRLSDQVTVFLHEAPDPSEEQWEQLTALGVPVVRPRVERLVMEGAQVRGVEIEGGRVFEADAAVVVPKFIARTEIYESLGGRAERDALGSRIPAEPSGATGIPGVWAAGNASNPMAMVMAAAASGVAVGAAVHGDLALADLERAMRARRGAVE